MFSLDGSLKKKGAWSAKRAVATAAIAAAVLAVGGGTTYAAWRYLTPQEAAAELEALPAEYYTCHCTGAEQYAYLKERMTRLHYLAAGDVLEV